MENEKRTTYHEQLTVDNTLKLRQLLKRLPAFAKDYFRAIEPTTSTKTRISYAYDLIVFGGGDVDITTYYPISLMSTEDTAQIVIVNGSVEVKSNSGAFAILPYLDEYNDAGKEVEFILKKLVAV
jgi:hypothetical protein